MVLFVLATLLLPSAADRNLAELQQMFTSFKARFNYDFRGDDSKRVAIFHDNVRYIDEVNAQNLSYRLGINKFAHLTREEFRDMMGLRGILNPGSSLLRSRTKPATRPFKFEGKPDDDLPMRVDWRDKGYVTPVTHQGSCGSCWAFSATGALEALHKNMTGRLVSLSKQELVDCSGFYGNHGCQGGFMTSAFQFVEDKGLESEASYPYTAEAGACQLETLTVNSEAEVKAGTVGFSEIEENSERSLQAAVADYGPVSVAVEATEFQFYKEGIISSTSCGTELNHGVLVVGFVRADSLSDEIPYFIVKNSWGADWGICGILMMPSMPVKI